MMTKEQAAELCEETYALWPHIEITAAMYRRFFKTLGDLTYSEVDEAITAALKQRGRKFPPGPPEIRDEVIRGREAATRKAQIGKEPEPVREVSPKQQEKIKTLLEGFYLSIDSQQRNTAK